MNRHVSEGVSVNSNCLRWLVAVGLVSMVVLCHSIQFSHAAAELENAFLKLGDIKGQATTKGYEDQIVVQSMSYGLHQASTWPDNVQLKERITSFADMTILKQMDRSSPSLANACATRQLFPKAEFAIASMGQASLKVILEGVIVSSVRVGFQPSVGRPMETITLSYRKATWNWGLEKTSYDLKQNTN